MPIRKNNVLLLLAVVCGVGISQDLIGAGGDLILLDGLGLTFRMNRDDIFEFASPHGFIGPERAENVMQALRMCIDQQCEESTSWEKVCVMFFCLYWVNKAAYLNDIRALINAADPQLSKLIPLPFFHSEWNIIRADIATIFREFRRLEITDDEIIAFLVVCGARAQEIFAGRKRGIPVLL